MVGPLPEPRVAERGLPGRLDSWKAIAAYLKRDVTTVQRWERRERMPVHRHVHEKRGSVYAFASELDAWRGGRSALLDEPSAAPESEPPPSAPAAQASGRTGAWFPSLRSMILVALLVLALATVPYYILRRERSADAAPPKITSLAVLPFRNLSGDPAQQYLADGMTEALIDRLAGIRDLRVISHTSVMRFHDPELSVPQIGRTLGVGAIVEGSVTRTGNRIRVTAQLIRAASDQHFWSQSYVRHFEDVLALQSELSQAIAERVEASVTGAEHARLTAARAVAPEVYESYLRGWFAYNNSKSRTDLEQSIGDFQGAIRQDSTFAPAYVGLAQAFTQLGMVAIGGAPDETRPKALNAARRALELDPDLAQAHVLVANIEQEQWHWAQAEAEYHRALDVSPNNADAHTGFALWLLCQGRTEEALSWAQRGRRLNPLGFPNDNLAWILFQSRRYPEALRELRSALALQPDNIHLLSDLGFVLSAIDRDAEAIPPLEKAVALSKGGPAATGVLIRAYARSGRRTEALRLLEDLKARRAAGYVPAAAFVNAYLGLADTEAAFVWLEQAYREQSNILQFLKVHPYFDPIRADPRFADLVRRVQPEADR